MASTSKSKTTKTTKTAAKAKGPAKAKRTIPMPKSAAPATATLPSVTTVLVEMVAEAFPNVPNEQSLLDTLTKRGLHASQSTIKTVREHAKRVLTVLTNTKRFTPKSK